MNGNEKNTVQIEIQFRIKQGNYYSDGLSLNQAFTIGPVDFSEIAEIMIQFNSMMESLKQVRGISE